MIKTMSDFYKKIDISKLDEQKKIELIKLYSNCIRSISSTLENDDTDLLKLMNVGKSTNKLYVSILNEFNKAE